MRYHADVISIVIKKADKGCSVVMWDHDDYKDRNVYKDVEFNEKILQDLAENNNKILWSLQSKRKINENPFKYFICEYKKTSNLGKLYLLPKK